MKTDYQVAKSELKSMAVEAKTMFRHDKPAIRQIINDSCDSLCKTLCLSYHRRSLLENYACKLHPK